ncbi:hypothetical protein TNCV_1873671 [Trichonephila clavipes]|nr:hypothetical protein TNCV_1873671 [Trichonephila clavipes]
MGKRERQTPPRAREAPTNQNVPAKAESSIQKSRQKGKETKQKTQNGCGGEYREEGIRFKIGKEKRGESSVAVHSQAPSPLEAVPTQAMANGGGWNVLGGDE